MIAFDQLYASDLPPPAAPFAGFPRYNFIGGHNDPAIVPVDGLIESAERVLREQGRTLATYNPDGARGHQGLRTFVARKLEDQRGIQGSADDVLITSGSLQGLDLVNDLLLERGDVVIMEQLTYQGSITRVKRKGVEIVGIPLDDDGLRTDRLAEVLDRMKRDRVRPKYIYVIPTVQNPTGTVMSLERRHELLALSAEFGVPLFEDECYADLLWEGAWPPALRALPGGGEAVIHIGSFSKSLAPALRLGYVSAPEEVLRRLVALKQDGGTPALSQMIVADFFGRHFEEHVRTLKTGLKRKLDVLTAALEEQFGTAAEFRVPGGGIFLWVTIPGVDTGRLASAALAEGIAYNVGTEWSTEPEPARESMRLCFALPDEATLQDGIRKLADVCHRETGIPERSANVARS